MFELHSRDDSPDWIVLARIAEQLRAAETFEEISLAAKSAARQLSGADGVTIVLRDGPYCHYVDEEAISPLWKGQRFPLDACISGWCMLHGAVAVIPDIYADPRIPADAYRPTFVKSLVMTPVGGAQPVAAIGAYWATRHTPDEKTVALLGALARLTATALVSVERLERVRRSELKLQALLDALPAAIYTTDADGRVEYFNRAAIELVGQTPEGDAGQWGRRLKLLTSDGEPLLFQEAAKAAGSEQNRPMQGVEAVAERSDGGQLRFLAHPTALYDDKGEPIGAANMLVDITEQKQTEETLLRKTEHLETLNTIAKTLSSDLDLRRIVQYVTDCATRLSGARFGAFFYNLIDENGEKFQLYTLSGASREAFDKFGLPRNTAVFDPTFRGAGIVRSDDIRLDPRFGKSAPHYGMPEGHLPVVSYLAVPVISRSGEVHGGLFFGHDKVGVFNQEAEDIVAGIAGHAALAIDNARLLQRAQIENENRKRAEALQSAQKKALELVVRNAPLSEVLDTLLRALEEDSTVGLRCSILLLSEDGGHLLHGAAPGLPESYNAAIDGVQIGPNVGSCGAAAYRKQQVFVSDISTDPLWTDFRDLALAHGLRACWSVPIMSVDGTMLGTFAVYYSEPREPRPHDLEMMEAAARTAALVIERKRAEEALKKSREQLQSELEDSTLLQRLSAELARERNVEALFDKIVVAAGAIMRSDFATMQAFHPARGEKGELQMLASTGFAPEVIKFWDWVRADSGCTCGEVLRTGRRAIVEDVETCDFMAGTADREALLDAGIRAGQSTPLFSRNAKLVGMISTHWRRPHKPSERDLRLLDILARQAADLIERQRWEQELRDSEERFRMLADNMDQLAWTCDELGEVTWYNQRWLDYTGLSFEEMKDWGWKLVQHPDHVDRVVASVTRCRETGEEWEDVFPLRGKDGTYRWFLSRAVPIRNADGDIVRWFGTNTDITEQRQAEETQHVLTSELSHRVKNMLATVQAIATQTLRHNDDPAQFVASFSGRIQSMSRVHAMLSSSEWQGAELRDLILDQLVHGPVEENRIEIQGPAVRFEAHMTPHVAMMLHELGTNSIKYGALSNSTGIVTIAWKVERDVLDLEWRERGGPPVTGSPKRGFGSSLIERSASGAGGSAQVDMRVDGVVWKITLPLSCASVGESKRRSSTARRGNGALPRPPAPKPDGAQQILAGKRFLVVEDEPLVALDIVASLEQAGAEIAGSTSDISEALALIEGSEIHAVLLDGNLHGRPVDAIAAALVKKNVPFSFVTGYGRESLPPEFMNSAVLQKPFSERQLLEAARKLLNNSR